MAFPEFLERVNTADKKFGYYADDHCGHLIARAGLDFDTYTTQVRNLVVCGYEVTDLTLTQQVALLLSEPEGG